MSHRSSENSSKSIPSPFGQRVLQRLGLARVPGPESERSREDAFAKWFAGSKVVDPQGRPLTLFHGSPHSFATFDPKRARENGFFFTADAEHAEMYAGSQGALMPVHLAIRNPMRVDGWQLPPRASQKLIKQMIADAKAGGHDGVLITRFRDHIWGTSDTYIAFEPTQIKSVFNAGTYDADNPDIRFGRTAAVTLPPIAPASAAAARDAWSAGSKVVDATGAPLTVYHGTASDVTTFHGPVTWVGATRDLANAYAIGKGSAADGGANIMPLHANLRQPLELGPVGNHRTLAALREQVGFDFPVPAALADLPEAHLHPIYRVVNTPEFIAAAIAAGYDGLFGYEAGRKTWGAFSPTALKSALGNRGTYDADDADIRFARTASARLAALAAMPTTEREANFRAWFRDSQVVDDAGAPLQVFHGTRSRFHVFSHDAATFGQAFYFTPSPQGADNYARNTDGDYEAGSQLMPVHLSLQQPLIIDYAGRADDDGLMEAIEAAKAGGHDGVIARNTHDGYQLLDQYVVFAPTQIKSVFNAGTYDAENPDIRFARSRTATLAEAGPKGEAMALSAQRPKPSAHHDSFEP